MTRRALGSKKLQWKEELRNSSLSLAGSRVDDVKSVMSQFHLSLGSKRSRVRATCEKILPCKIAGPSTFEARSTQPSWIFIGFRGLGFRV